MTTEFFADDTDNMYEVCPDWKPGVSNIASESNFDRNLLIGASQTSQSE